MKLLTYLNYGGNCAEAFRFYEKHLGGKITMMMTHGESPVPAPGPALPKDSILHGRITIGGTELLASDVSPTIFEPIRSVYLSLSLDTSEEAERVFALLSDGGQIFMHMAETFFAYRFGMLRDRFGASWMILHERPQA